VGPLCGEFSNLATLAPDGDRTRRHVEQQKLASRRHGLDATVWQGGLPYFEAPDL